jgi:hypothetical protein
MKMETVHDIRSLAGRRVPNSISRISAPRLGTGAAAARFSRMFAGFCVPAVSAAAKASARASARASA